MDSKALFLKEKNEMRTRHVSELRPLEKKVKQQKGAYREKAEQLLFDLRQKHNLELANLEKKYDVDKEKQKKTTQAESAGKVSKKLDLLKSPLKELKAQKEDAQEEEEEEEEKKKKKSNEVSLEKASAYMKSPDGAGSKKVTKVIEKKFKETQQDQSAVINEAVGSKEAINDLKCSLPENEDDLVENSITDSDVENNLDIPDSQKILGSGREDLRSKKKKFPNIEKYKQKKKEENKTTQRNTKQNTQETSHYKRERVVQMYLTRILDSFPDGLPLKSIILEFENVKLRNFTPKLLGYSDLKDWITNQPPHVVNYDSSSEMIYPPAKQGASQFNIGDS